MLTLIIKKIIKDRENVESLTVRQQYGVVCGVVGIILNIILFLIKLLAGIISGSIAITADAINNLSDAGSSLIMLFGFKLAGQKPDSEHPFGHGRMEYLSGLFVSVAILVMGFELIKDSIDKIINPVAVEFSLIILVILVISVLVKGYMAYYNRAIGKKINSSVMMATSKDSLSDMLSTSVVLISMLLGYYLGINIDGICGVGVGVLIFFAGVSSIKETSDPLLGQAPEPEFVNKIKAIVLASEKIIGIHDLVVHNYGPGRVMISLHAEVSANDNILLVHDEIDNIEKKLNEELCCEAIIHMDPIVTDDVETNNIKLKLNNIISEIDERMSFHDLRLVKGPTHTNIIFDIVVPYDFKESDIFIKDIIASKIKEIDENYYTVICIDRSYIKLE